MSGIRTFNRVERFPLKLMSGFLTKKRDILLETRTFQNFKMSEIAIFSARICVFFAFVSNDFKSSPARTRTRTCVLDLAVIA